MPTSKLARLPDHNNNAATEPHEQTHPLLSAQPGINGRVWLIWQKQMCLFTNWLKVIETMARRKELTNIASGIAGSFNSRNNDVGGYWAIGKLYKFVEAIENKRIEVDLIHKAISPSTDEFNTLLLHYHAMLSNRLLSRGIPFNWVASAKVTAVFESEFQQKHHFWRSGLGKPCVVSCEIVDDKGRNHTAFAYNNCKPHDPKKESKSDRANDV